MSSTPELQDWQRPYFAQAADSNLIYFVVYGKRNEEMQIPGVPYRILYMPQNLQFTFYDESNEGKETVEQFRTSIFGELLQEQHPELVDSVNAQTNCFIVQVASNDSDKLNDLRVAIGLATYLLDNGCVAAFDITTRKWWTPQAWRENVFEPEEFNTFAHIRILAHKQEDGTYWVHTLGMRKFGRPDLSIHQVNDENIPVVEEMIKRFVNYMALGGNITNGQEIKMKGLPEGMLCERIENLDDPEFGNRYVEINWPK